MRRRAAPKVCATGQIYVHADRVEITSAGVLVLMRDTRYNATRAVREPHEHPHPNLVFAVGSWSYVFAASVIDGAAVAVEHWKGEVAE